MLLQREKLGTTAVGYGVAIPHGKLPKLEKLFGLFARLERPIDFEAMDGQPVDLIFLLLAPEGAGADHLKALARIARLLRDQDVAKKLRASRDAQAIYSGARAAAGKRGVNVFNFQSENTRAALTSRTCPRIANSACRVRLTCVSARSPPAARCSRHWRSPLRGCRSA